jgi:caffeoyl-CoA O-methyltransferase
MFHPITDAILQRMEYLERLDARDRVDGTPHQQRMRQVPPETGKFIALMAASTPPGNWIEIGTSAGYSTLWLALAAHETGKTITTYEILAEKAALARQTFREAGVESLINLIEGDARDYLPDISNIAFCFLDAEKNIYADCYESVVPNLVTGGLLLADNAINHQAALQPILDRALQDERVDALIVPIGKGVLLCRKRAG